MILPKRKWIYIKRERKRRNKFKEKRPKEEKKKKKRKRNINQHGSRKRLQFSWFPMLKLNNMPLGSVIFYTKKNDF